MAEAQNMHMVAASSRASRDQPSPFCFKLTMSGRGMARAAAALRILVATD